ncbi:hypothetical protein BpHYR1_040494 [Brachionus plicatilis]|uniref:Uncharacterized protein n=1 Tax=Brachionus plicatilis TaxID=10195 RepID=A0A3M7RJ32_BRAPC|nr:hypothetical protein BpHYR1_040494 [Brachionus plicatilis]
MTEELNFFDWSLLFEGKSFKDCYDIFQIKSKNIKIATFLKSIILLSTLAEDLNNHLVRAAYYRDKL